MAPPFTVPFYQAAIYVYPSLFGINWLDEIRLVATAALLATIMSVFSSFSQFGTGQALIVL
jgi:hypothetical protein